MNSNIPANPGFSDTDTLERIQLFRERLSKIVHATIPKGIVGSFELTVLHRNLKELARKAMKMCLRVLKESIKSRFDSYSRQEQSIDHMPYYLSGLSRAHFFRQPFSKQLYIKVTSYTSSGSVTLVTTCKQQLFKSIRRSINMSQTLCCYRKFINMEIHFGS